MSEGTTGGLVSDEARAMIGCVTGRAEGRVVREEFQRWAAAVGDRNPLYFDACYARAHGYRDVIAPPLYVQYATLGVADPSRLRPDGTPEDGDSPVAVPLPRCPRRMAGGQDIASYQPLYDGMVVTAVRTVTGVEEKRGRTGPFVLVTSLTRYFSDDGVLVAEIGDSVIALPEATQP
jgi:hydroxyacyl-ACP dehydratase HTD2-like protein with hotdog domain